MAVRTITRESRSVLVWPQGVTPDAVKTNDDGVNYAKVDGEILQPVAFPAHDFKAAFGFVPKTGSIAEYEISKIS